MNSKIEQMQERARKEMQHWNPEWSVNDDNKLDQLITEVWNEAIKECEGCVPEEMPRPTVHEMAESAWKLETSYCDGSDNCRNQTLQAINKLRS